jgi:hypothetical protein
MNRQQFNDDRPIKPVNNMNTSYFTTNAVNNEEIEIIPPK